MSETTAELEAAIEVALTPRTIANRRNARKSTGPKTARGKAASSRNAVKHGLFCANLVIESPEEREEFQRFVTEVEQRFRPVDVIERLLVERFVNAAWRLRRAQDAETDAVRDLRHSEGDWMGLGQLLSYGDRRIDNLLRYEQGFERSMYRALNQLLRLQTLRHKQQPAEPQEQNEANVAASLSRLQEEVDTDQQQPAPSEAIGEAPGQNEPNAPEEASGATIDQSPACGSSDPERSAPPAQNEPNAEPPSSAFNPRPQRGRRHLKPFDYHARHIEKMLNTAKSNLQILNAIEECYGHESDPSPDDASSPFDKCNPTADDEDVERDAGDERRE